MRPLGVARQIAAGLVVLIACESGALAQGAADAPWRGAGGRGTVLLPQTEGPPRAPGALCARRPIVTQSLLDTVKLPQRAVAVVTPPIAQTAGLVAMVHADQRNWVFDLAVQRLQAAGKWTAEAEEGLFDYLRTETDKAREELQRSRAVIGGTAGGLLGALGGGLANSMAGGFATGRQDAEAGARAGAQGLQALAPVEFAIRTDERSVISVIDALIAKPCDYSAGDALRALRAR